MLNKLLLTGYLTRDPTLRMLPKGNSATSFGLASSRRFKTAHGETKNETLFIDCTAFGRIGEVIAQHLKKGSRLFCEGRLKLDEWTDPDGTNRRKIYVVVESFEFMDHNGSSKNDEMPSAKEEQHSAAPAVAGMPVTPATAHDVEYGNSATSSVLPKGEGLRDHLQARKASSL